MLTVTDQGERALGSTGGSAVAGMTAVEQAARGRTTPTPAREAARGHALGSWSTPSSGRYPKLMPQNYGALERVLRMGEGRRLKRLGQQAAYVTSLEPDFEKLSDADLAAKTVEFRERVERGESIDELVFEAYAAVREAARRSLGMRPFDVQLMGGMVLHARDISEMKTGEGRCSSPPCRCT